LTTARFYVHPTDLQERRLRLEGTDHHHLSRVLRMRKGQTLQLLDGRGCIGTASIADIAPAFTLVVIDEVAHVSEERPRLHLFQAMPGGSKMDRVVQWCVELGAATVTPFACERSRSLEKAAVDRLERWSKIALESSRVAGRPYLPGVKKPLCWEDALAELDGFGVALFADETGRVRPRDSLKDDMPGELGLLIGPEGGFSDKEREQLVAKGARSVSLGKTVLRTETAGMVLLAAVRCHYGML
jgi:16S rRNA (uracil1498-N3)-methyltransferase